MNFELPKHSIFIINFYFWSHCDKICYSLRVSSLFRMPYTVFSIFFLLLRLVVIKEVSKLGLRWSVHSLEWHVDFSHLSTYIFF